ncbi:MAG: thioredoxin domain-containing protein [Oligoflexia bacterium]|nr:thioredoxin domain-containing protein [Oligoflexia bacterium]
MKKFLVLGMILSAALVGCQKNAGDNEDEAVFVTVNGKDIKGKQVLEKIRGELTELERNAYELKRRAIEEVVQNHILEEEAKKQGTTVQNLFSQFDGLKDKDVSKEDIKGFLGSRNIDEKKLSKAERDSVPQIIKMQRVMEARQRYLAELKSKASIQVKLKRPAEKAVTVGNGQGTAKGNKGAKVTIVEFSDFQCPFCRRGRDRLNEIVSKYGDKVQIYFRHFPLESIHPHAFKASEASICAREQGKFWEYHDLLFDQQDKLEEKDLLAHAETLKLDTKAFGECLKSGKGAAEIRADMEEATKIGVNSTPTFFVNGFAVRGAQPLEAFSERIDELLSK